MRYTALGYETWSRRRESNPQPAVYKTAALPLSYVGILDMPIHIRFDEQSKANKLVVCRSTRRPSIVPISPSETGAFSRH